MYCDLILHGYDPVDESERAWVKFKTLEHIIVDNDMITLDTSKPKPKTDANRAARRKAKR